MAMTLGKDVSALFPDVLKNIATSDLDQKKLVYLYLMCVSIHTLNIASNTALSGTMRNPTPTSASWLSIPLFKTPKTPTPSYVRLLSEPWAAFE
jgi:hypothetical protein